MLEADEKAAAYKKSSWKSEEAVLGNVAAVELKNENGDEKRNNNSNSNTCLLYTSDAADDM
eukprot:11379700-Prorocentrum_lima.AAC.1